MNNKFLAATVATVFSLTSFCAVSAAPNYNYSAQPVQQNYGYGQQQSPLQGQVVFVPLGVTTPAVLTMPIDSETMTVGSSVSATLPADFVYNGKTIAPMGSMAYGTVTLAKAAGRANRNAQIQVRFNCITTPQGFNIPISAVVMTDDGSGILKGGTKMDSAKDYGKNTAIGAAGGAVLGTALGPLSGGSVGKGAVYGTAVGAGLGLLKGVALDKGGTVEIPANATINLYFDQPITMSAPSGYYY